MAIRTIINNDPTLRNAEIDYARRQLQASERSHEFNPLKAFAIAKKIGGNNEDYENLQGMINESRSQQEILQDMMVVQSHQASELKRSNKSQILRFYELVNAVGKRYG
jgi:hypothetical protein